MKTGSDKSKRSHAGLTGRKRKRRKPEEEQSIPPAHEGSVCGDDEDPSEDENLTAAAEAWAQQEKMDGPTRDAASRKEANAPIETSHPSRTRRTRVHASHPPTSTAQSPTDSQAANVLSLHVTQLSFDATEMDVRHHFVSHGCAVTSVRLVYDHGPKKKSFRGVAFVDVLDKKSQEIALQKLHHSTLLGRRINVRPTRSKQELGSIVERTMELVARKIKLEKDRVREEERSKEGATNSKADNQGRKSSVRKTVESSNKKAKLPPGKKDPGRKLSKKGAKSPCCHHLAEEEKKYSVETRLTTVGVPALCTCA